MKRIVCALALLAAAGIARAQPAAPVIDLVLDGRRSTLPADAWIARVESALAPGRDAQVLEMGRDAHTSHHLVGIRTGEPLHRHDRHDLIVVLLRGHGSMRLGDGTRPVGQGSVLYVPRGTPHAFRNDAGADAPAFAHVIYAPPFDGEDRVLVGD